MTQTIRETIKQLPDDANVEAYPHSYDSDTVLVAFPVADLKSLVSRLDDAERLLKGIKCPECKGKGQVWLPMTSEWGCCFSCNETGLHPDASAYFERWK